MASDFVLMLLRFYGSSTSDKGERAELSLWLVAPTSSLSLDLLCLSAFYERDPVDLALDWVEPGMSPIPVIMPANDKRPGGDWEAGMQPILRFTVI